MSTPDSDLPIPPKCPDFVSLIASVQDPKDKADLILRQRELELAKDELRFKREDAINERKLKVSPFVTTIIAGVAALLSGFVTAIATQSIELRKFRLAEHQFQWELIKSALSSESHENRLELLRFVLRTGFLDPDFDSRKLEKEVERDEQNQMPSVSASRSPVPRSSEPQGTPKQN
jgi:hypothetical protein